MAGVSADLCAMSACPTGTHDSLSQAPQLIRAYVLFNTEPDSCLEATRATYPSMIPCTLYGHLGNISRSMRNDVAEVP